MSYLSKFHFQLQTHPHWSISSCIHLSMAMKAGLAFALFFWAQRALFQSFLAVRPGSWGVPAQGQSRFAGPSKMNRQTRTCAFSPRSGDVRVSNSCVVRKSVFSGHVQRPVLAVSAGDYHTCAVRADGQLVCFGRTYDGQRDVPADLGPILEVSAGAYHTCAMRSDGQLVCFGRTDERQCDVPADLGPVLAVSAGDFLYLCGAGRWSARLLWTIRFWTA